MKKALIAALVCVNILLVAMLIDSNINPAQAQTERGANNYLMVTGSVGSDDADAVFILDLKNRKLGAWRYNRNAKRMVPYRGRTLKTDFGAR